MRRCLLVFLSVLPLLVTECKKEESNLTQSTSSPTASASPTPVAQATPTPPDTNRAAKFIVLLYHRFEDRPAELVTTPNSALADLKARRSRRGTATLRQVRDINVPADQIGRYAIYHNKPSRHKTKKDTFGFRLPAETKRLLELAADRTGRTLGGYVDYALKIQFKKDGVA